MRFVEEMHAGGRSQGLYRARVGLPWLLSVPLMVAGSEAAHVVAYRLAYPDPVQRAAVLASSGHGYFAYAPLALAVGLALVVCSLAGRCSDARAGDRPVAARVPAGAFAALPPATFVLQEHLERLIHDGAMPFGAALEPTFLFGLALQVPFALAAYGIARLLLRAAERLGVRLRTAPPRPRPTAPPPRRRPRTSDVLPLRAPVAAGSSSRGPPL